MSVLQPVLVGCVLVGCMLCLGIAGCQRAAPPISSDDAGKPATSNREPPDVASGAHQVSYRCADGSSLDVVYAGANAELRWPDGRRLVLPRAESASKGGSDVYVGDTVSLQHDGDNLQLHGNGAPILTCEHH
jgi:membrane-bound inhibitor of C-type lysozyme